MKRYSFTRENINKAPSAAGVYILYVGTETIYIGRAKGTTETIRSRLSDHYHGRGSNGPCTKVATLYSREVTSTPVSREKELQQAYVNRHGKLPRCNDRIG